MNILDAHFATHPLGNPSASLEEPTAAEAASAFSQLLYGVTPETSLSPHDMLLRQAEILEVTSGVDLGAKVAGLVAQSINKLVNMA